MTKKVLLTLTALFITVCAVKAQDDFKLGLTAHPTIGWLRSDVNTIDSDGMRFGFSYGLLGDFVFAENYAFSTALKLSTINGKTVENNETVKRIYKLQYLEVPTKLKLLTNENDGLRFFGEFGLGNAFNVRARQDVKFTDPNVAQEENININKQTPFYRGSIVLGAGAEISVSDKTRLMAGLTFDNGFTKINKGDALKSSYLGINIGVFF